MRIHYRLTAVLLALGACSVSFAQENNENDRQEIGGDRWHPDHEKEMDGDGIDHLPFGQLRALGVVADARPVQQRENQDMADS